MNIRIPTEKIIIAGAGFGGIKALDTLYHLKKKAKKPLAITLLDQKDTYEFLPLLPDILAGWLAPEATQVNLLDYAKTRGCEFIQGQITDIKPREKVILVDGEPLGFDYALLSCGVVPNFFGNESASKNCFLFKSVTDALSIQKHIIKIAKDKQPLNMVIIGGGYTGLEVAMATHFLMRRHKIQGDISIVELADDILMMIPQWLRANVRKELEKYHIRIITQDTLSQYADNRVTLKSGKIIDNALCVWNAGVKAPGFMNVFKEHMPKNRVNVNANLNIENSDFKNIFMIGDSASFIPEGTDAPLRMAIMFALAQGKTAAQNIINTIAEKPLLTYKPLDLGYLIPLMYNKAPGIVFKQKIPGSLGYWLHYFMCVYRSESSNRLPILKDLISQKRNRDGKTKEGIK